ncbi:hypothetical protein DL96DRAFT_1625588 [Flagelloscypha sp. PMI_526]|nr:hypothetical protein DL96DRAFT_1625588 [Flagelloscypha sp. PMI_526]
MTSPGSFSLVAMLPNSESTVTDGDRSPSPSLDDHGLSSTWPLVPNPRKEYKINLVACDTCRRTKKKCNLSEGTPCSACKKSQRDCTFSEQRKRGTPIGSRRGHYRMRKDPKPWDLYAADNSYEVESEDDEDLGRYNFPTSDPKRLRHPSVSQRCNLYPSLDIATMQHKGLSTLTAGKVSHGAEQRDSPWLPCPPHDPSTFCPDFRSPALAPEGSNSMGQTKSRQYPPNDQPYWPSNPAPRTKGTVPLPPLAPPSPTAARPTLPHIGQMVQFELWKPNPL